MAEKTQIPGIFKVSEGVFINKDANTLQAYKRKKMREKKVDNIENEVANLRQDMQEIKQLLKGLIK